MTAPEVVVVRPRKTLIAATASAAAIVVLFVVSAVLLRSDTGVYFRSADQVSIGVLGLLLAAGALLFARPRVRADAAGVEVRNVLSSRRLAWADVRRVAFPDGAPWARLELADDEYLPVLAIQAVDGQRAVDGIRRVRALHAAAGAR